MCYILKNWLRYLKEKKRAKPKIHHKKQEIDPILLDAILTILLGGNNMIRKFKVTVDGKVHHIEIEETTVGSFHYGILCSK